MGSFDCATHYTHGLAAGSLYLTNRSIRPTQPQVAMMVRFQPSRLSLVCLLCLAGCILVSMSPPAQAQTTSRPNNGHTRAPRALQHNDLRFNAYVNEKTGTPSWILDVDLLDFTLGKERVLSSAESVGEATQAFLAAYADAFGIHPDDLVLNRISSSDDLWFVSYRQVYGGIPVLGAEVGVTVSRDGRLVAAGVEAFPDLKVAVTPRLGSSAATEAARRHAARSSAEAVGTQELVIVPEEGNGRPLCLQAGLADPPGRPQG